MAAEGAGDPDILALVEANQTTHASVQGQDGPDGRINLAAITYHYAHVSSYRDGGSAAPNAIDGKPQAGQLSIPKTFSERPCQLP